MGTPMSFALVDSDILIDFSLGVKEALESLVALESQFDLVVSTVTVMELMVGCRNKSELRSVKRLLQRFEVWHLDEMISAEAVALLEQYRLSHGLLIADALIAATARVRNIPLATKNQRDYRFIEGLTLLPYPYEG
jgi:predicted nucleic acid-binding protein